MRTLATIGLLLALLAPSAARADAIATNGADWVRLTAAMCTSPQIVTAITAAGKHPDLFRAAAAHVGGKDYAVCWTPAPGGALLLYEDGDQGLIPLADLKAAPEA